MEGNSIRPAVAPDQTAGAFLPWRPVAGELSPEFERRVVWLILAVGIIARSVRYFLRFPLWDDESFLAVNFLDRGFVELLAPLDYHQVAPPLFLWVELALVKLFGFNELSLRLFPFLSSVAALVGVAYISPRLVRGPARLVAVALLSASYPCIRYAAEAKPYGSDLFVAVVLLGLLVSWLACPGRQATLWYLTLAAPIAIGLSYPAVFILGMSSAVIGCTLWRTGLRRGWVAWAALNLVILATVMLVQALVAAGQAEAELGFMQSFWKQALVPVDSVWSFAKWLVATHTSDLMGFPFGGPRYGSTLSLFFWLVGLAGLLRSRRWSVAAICLAPLALQFVAAALGRYPYGGHVKFSMYMAPLLCIVIAGGIATLVGGRMPHFDAAAVPRLRQRLAVAVGIVLVVAVGTIVRDVWSPYKTATDARCRDFARWFWFNHAVDGEVVCLKSDWNLSFSERSWRELNWSAMYLCNQRIYSPRHASSSPPALDKVSPEHPLRCVHYRTAWYPPDQARVDEWLAGMRLRYDLVSVDRYPFASYTKWDGRFITQDSIEVYHFVPLGSGMNVAWRDTTLPGGAARQAH